MRHGQIYIYVMYMSVIIIHTIKYLSVCMLLYFIYKESSFSRPVVVNEAFLKIGYIYYSKSASFIDLIHVFSLYSLQLNMSTHVTLNNVLIDFSTCLLFAGVSLSLMSPFYPSEALSKVHYFVNLFTLSRNDVQKLNRM